MKSLTLDKDSILKILNDFPQEVNLEDFINKVMIVGKVEKALEQFKNGEYLTEKELDEEMKSW